MTNYQTRYVMQVRRHATSVERVEMASGKVNVVWVQGGQRHAVNVERKG